MAWYVCQDSGLEHSPNIIEVDVQSLRDGKSFMWQCGVLKAFLLIQEADVEVLAIPIWLVVATALIFGNYVTMSFLNLFIFFGLPTALWKVHSLIAFADKQTNK